MIPVEECPSNVKGKTDIIIKKIYSATHIANSDNDFKIEIIVFFAKAT